MTHLTVYGMYHLNIIIVWPTYLSIYWFKYEHNCVIHWTVDVLLMFIWHVYMCLCNLCKRCLSDILVLLCNTCLHMFIWPVFMCLHVRTTTNLERYVALRVSQSKNWRKLATIFLFLLMLQLSNVRIYVSFYYQHSFQSLKHFIYVKYAMFKKSQV